MMIMLKMDIIMAVTSTGMSRPASVFIQKGVTKGERSVVLEVMVTDRGTLPPAR